MAQGFQTQLTVIVEQILFSTPLPLRAVAVAEGIEKQAYLAARAVVVLEILQTLLEQEPLDKDLLARLLQLLAVAVVAVRVKLDKPATPQLAGKEEMVFRLQLREAPSLVQVVVGVERKEQLADQVALAVAETEVLETLQQVLLPQTQDQVAEVGQDRVDFRVLADRG